MKKVPRLLLVTFLNQGFVALLTFLIYRTLTPSHFSNILVYFPRPLFLAVSVAFFYSKSVARVPSFLGLHKKAFRPWLLGGLLTIPSGLLLLLFLSWKRLPLAFDPVDAAWHLGFIFIGVALFEEGLFRGLVFRQLLTLAPWWRAGFYSGILFAFIHLGNLMIGYPLPHVIYQLAHTFTASLLWGYLTWKLKGNIWACVAYHTFNNFYAAAFIAAEEIQRHIVSFSLFSLLGLAIAFVAAWILLGGNREPE